ncbi:MAG: E3 binding domain-containing protein, partial [Eubacterium sp.]
MAVEIILPKLGMDMQSGIIMTWYKNEGDTIKKGEPLFELMTDKVNIEVEAEDSGTLLKKFYETGVELPVFTTIGYLGTPGEKIPDKESMEIGLSSDTLSAEDRAALRSIRGGRHDGFSAGAKTVRATPAARRMALQNKVDLNTINGSGPKGRIQVEDVEEAIQSPKNIKKTEIPQQKVFVIDDEPKAEEVVEWIDGDKEVVENPGMKDSLDMTLEDLVARMSHSEEKIGEKAFGKIDAMDQEQEEKEKELEEKELEEQGQPEIEAVEKMPRQQAVLSPLAEKIVEVEKINIA